MGDLDLHVPSKKLVSLELLLESGGILGGLNDNESVSRALLFGEVDVLTVQKIFISLSSKIFLSQ